MTFHTILLGFHIFVGALSIASGFIGLTARKGSPRHLRSGKAFLLTMTCMCLSGALLSVLGGITISLLVSVFTLYLLATAWRASRRFRQIASWADVAGCTLTSFLAVCFFYFGHLASISPSGMIDDIPIGPVPYYVFGFVTLFCGLRDLVFILNTRRTIKQAQAPHIWRISVALFIATSSFFTGNPQVFPEWFSKSFISSLPEQTVLLIMAYYLLRAFISESIVLWFSKRVLTLKERWMHFLEPNHGAN